MAINVAPANVAKEFRSMLIKVAQQMTEDEIIRVYYEEGFSLELPPGLQDIRVHLLHKLEAKGVFSPKNPDGFANLLKRLPREDLVVEVTKYTQTYIRPNIFLKLKAALMKRSALEVKQLPPASEEQENPQDDLEDMFALAMTHASSLMSVLEELRELMQEPLPREKLTTVAPQVKEAIAILSKEEQTVSSIHESLKQIVAAEKKTDEDENENGSGERYKKFSFSFRSIHTTLGRAQSTEILSPKSVQPVRKAETSFTSPESKQLTRSLTMDPKQSSQGSDHDYNEIVSMATMGNGYGNYDELPGRKQPVNSVIYDEVANCLDPEDPVSKQTKEDLENTNDYIFMTPQPQTNTSSSSKPSPKTGGKKEARDWLSKLKLKKTGASPTVTPPPPPEAMKNSPAGTTKPKRSPYTQLMILDKEEEPDYAELIKPAEEPQKLS